MKIKILIFLAIFMVVACKGNGSKTDGKTIISGNLVNGLRVLTIDSSGDKNFTIYRGDYIKPQLVGNDSFTLTISDLKVSKTFPSKEGEKGYVKMKKIGEFSYTAGEVKGKIKVIEYDEPNYKAVSADEAYKIIENISPLILDVRTPREYQSARIANSKLIPVQVLAQQIETISDYKDKDILIYCATGNRSTVASKILIDKGFKKIYNLKSGIHGWNQIGYPIER